MALESHHNPSDSKIVELIWQARRFWLDGKENDAGFQLGRALHYIHDGLVSKGFMGLFHGSNESKIQTLNISENILDSGIKDSRSDPFYVEDLVRSVSWKKPDEAIDRASYITAYLIKAVLNHQKTIPTGLKEKYKDACIQHAKYQKAGICGGIVLFSIGAFISYIGLILFAPILGFIIVKMDSEYYRVGKKWKWFNNRN